MKVIKRIAREQITGLLYKNILGPVDLNLTYKQSGGAKPEGVIKTEYIREGNKILCEVYTSSCTYPQTRRGPKAICWRSNKPGRTCRYYYLIYLFIQNRFAWHDICDVIWIIYDWFVFSIKIWLFLYDLWLFFLGK